MLVIERHFSVMNLINLKLANRHFGNLPNNLYGGRRRDDLADYL